MKESMDDKRYRMQMEERQGKMYGGRAKYSDGKLVKAKNTTVDELEEELDPDMFMSDEEAEDHQRKLDQDKMDRDLDEADKRFKENQRQGKMSGGSMLSSPEREEYSVGGRVFSLVAKALGKTTKSGKKPTRAKIQKAVDDVKKENPNLEKEIADDIQEVKDLRYVENYGVGGGGPRDIDSMFTSLLRGDTESIAMTSAPMKATKTYKKGQMKAGIAGAITAFGGKEAYDKLTKPTQNRFQKEFASAQKEGLDVFEFTDDEGKTYPVKVALAAENNSDVTYTKTKKAEGGSMLVPPEMEMEDEMPVDTYDNIPEDEKEAAEASQLPDDEMEEDYTSYVLEESLDMEEQEYLMGVLETDERLSGIFDKVMDVAGEFSGEGEVSGLGTGVSDSIPARLSDGEFVFTKKATDQMGADQLQTMMDEAEKAYDGGLMKKAFGGLTSDDAPEIEEEEEASLVRSRMVNADRMPSTNKG